MNADTEFFTETSCEYTRQLEMRRHIFKMLALNASQRSISSMFAETNELMDAISDPNITSALDSTPPLHTVNERDRSIFSEAKCFFEKFPQYVKRVENFLSDEHWEDEKTTQLHDESHLFTDLSQQISTGLKNLLDEQAKVLRFMETSKEEAFEDRASVQVEVSAEMESLKSHISTLVQSLARLFEADGGRQSDLQSDNSLQEIYKLLHGISHSSNISMREVGLNRLWAAKRATILLEYSTKDIEPSIASVISRCVPEEWKVEYTTYYRRLEEIFHLLDGIEKSKSFCNGEIDISLMIPIDQFKSVQEENEKLLSSLEALRPQETEISSSNKQIQEDAAIEFLQHADRTVCDSIHKWRNAKRNSIALRKSITEYYQLWRIQKAVSIILDKIKQQSMLESPSLDNQTGETEILTEEQQKKSIDKISSRKRAIEEENEILQTKLASLKNQRKRIAEKNEKLMPVTARGSENAKRRRSLTTQVQSEVLSVSSGSFFG
ncbi:sensory box protein [Perkinsela sp. CCAP 1560/4]|nr:sensory box protein [Perkinsela sp. CCAP 1560/4]|eukprot:KNH07851.1 sensory box protein [Perkinsela sp. CCAP 1560/4]